MSSSRQGSRRVTVGNDNNSNNMEPFPAMPESPAGPSSNNDYHTTTTTTTVHGPTITTSFARARPHTITSPHPTNQTPTSIVSAPPDNPVTTTSARPTTTTTRTSYLAPVPNNRNRPISIRRLPSSNYLRPDDGGSQPPSRSSSGRGRSTSAPQSQYLNIPGQHSNLTRQSTRQSMLPTVNEGAQAVSEAPAQDGVVDRETMNEGMGVGRRRSISNAARSVRSRFSENSRERREPEYDSAVVDLLDVLDPEVSTLTTLNNVQNSLFVPDLGRWINRRPTYNLSSRRNTQTRTSEPIRDSAMSTIPSQDTTQQPAPEPTQEELDAPATMQRTWSWQRKPQMERLHSITSVMTESHYAVLPHGVSLEGWSEEDKEALDDHVRHMMHSKRSKFKQRMIAFGKYIKKPLGLFVFLYATLITLFGLAWVLFLIGWIYSGDRKDYLTNVIDNVLVALFAVMGDGLAPFRMVDTYHMCFIAHYHHKSWRLRRERALPKLHDRNDLPLQREKEADPESAKPEDNEFSVLNQKQQQKLIHHQAKFSKSHSFYKPHETTTHYAFPLPLLVAIVCLLDCHSLFQIALGTCTWSISYHTRPQALTATILCCSITCNITAGILISIGDRKTRKKDVALRMQRQALTQTAIEKVERHKREKEQQAEEEARLDHPDGHRNFEVIDEETTESNNASQVNTRHY